MLSYAWLWLLKKIMGKNWYERRLLALHLRNAERVKTAILELKGLFIKLGQMLSILGNFLPEAFQKPLEALQDQIPARPFREVRERIISEFGKPPESIFTRFDEQAIASASIGQAHRAQLHDGTEVVVKVQHHNIENIASVDLEIIRRLTALISWIYNIKGMDYLYTQIKKMIEEELDFTKEAVSMQKIATNLASEPRFAIPTLHPEFSTARVMTTTWHEGVKISNTEQLDAWGLDRRDLATRVLQVYCRMVFKDGFYHADPHPGNILVKQDGTLVLLDFGAVAEISPALREGIPQLIEASVKNDTPAMIQALRSMGFLAEGREAEKMAGKMIGAFRNFLQNEVQFEGLNLKEIKVNPLNNSLTGLLSDIGLSGISGAVQVPKDYVLFNRSATLLLGLCSALDHTLNPLDVIRPYAKAFVMGEKENLGTFVRKLVQRSASTIIGLPDELSRVLNQVQKGDLEILSPDIRNSSKLIYAALNQLTFMILCITAAVFGWFFYQAKETGISQTCFGLSVFFLLLMFRAMRSGRRVLKGMD
jgi:predicted unusual protein kinase regulating ubiquinone biosynthesis (AarF/ABC1/UbiB family)